MFKDLTRRYPDVFTDMPGETNVIQHRVKLTNDTPIRCKPYSLAVRHEGRVTELSGQYARDGSCETINVALRITHHYG